MRHIGNVVDKFNHGIFMWNVLEQTFVQYTETHLLLHATVIKSKQ